MDDNNNKNSGENIEDIENEEYSSDNILGENGDESEDVAEILKRSETLKSDDDTDSSGSENNESAEAKEDVDLSDFLDDKKDDSIEDIDPELDKALSQFSDDGSDDNSENKENAENSEKEKRQKKFKFIKRVSIVSALCAVVIAAGILIFIQIDKYNNSYIMNFYGRNISVNDFQLFLLYSDGYYDDVKSAAIDQLSVYLVVEKAAQDRNLTLTDDEITEAKASAQSVRSQIDAYYPAASNISTEFLEEISGVGYLYSKLLDQVAIENGYTFDEADYQVSLADYILNGKQYYLQMQFKYIVAETEEAANEAKAAIEDGTLSADDAIKQYSTYYSEEYGIDIMALSDITFVSAEDLASIMEMETGNVSNVINLSGTGYILLIADSVYRPTEDEISASYKEQYESDKKYEIFDTELQKWQDEAKIKVNQKVLDNYDTETLLGTSNSDYSDYGY